MPYYDVAVIGLGAMGSAASFHLAERGQRVIALEQFDLGHDRGSSHGESRAIRLGYFEHPSYVPLVRHAYDNWARLERLTGQTLLTKTGIVEAGAPDGGLVARSKESCDLHGLAYETLDARETRARFPALQMPDGYACLWQPDGGFVRADRAIASYLDQARRLNADIRVRARVRDIVSRGSDVQVVLEDGIVEVGSVVVTAGPWIGELLPVLAPHLHLTRQVLCWYRPRKPALFAQGALPVFLVETDDDVVYGFPMMDGAASFKCASHRGSEPVAQAGAATQATGPADEARTRRFLQQFMPEGAGELEAMKTCIYTMTPDEDFIIDTLPADPRIVVASPCSGHGFKFASVIGEALADLASTGRTPIDLRRFRISRFDNPVLSA